MVTRWLQLPGRIVGAVVIGVATLFQPKADPRRHWSIPPTFPVDDEEAGAEGGEPPRPSAQPDRSSGT